jgi:DNA (cytosine-5)-methyltransferase 1
MPPFKSYPTPEPTSPSSESCSSNSGADHIDCPPPPLKRQKVSVREGNRCYPSSHYPECIPPLPLVSEVSAINQLAAVWNQHDQEFNIWHLDDFSVYRKPSDYRHANEMCPLHHLSVESGINELLFDGILTVNDEKRYIQGVPFTCLSVEGYGDDSNVVSAYIQTTKGKEANVWYLLGRPTREYRRYHHAFSWISRFTKYVVGYLEDSERPVTLHVFRKSFHHYVVQKYGSSTSTNEWMSQYKSQDFGQAFCAYVGFLFKECYSVNHELLSHPIFNQTDPCRLKAIPKVEPQYEKTVVTPFVFNLFHRMPFHSHMQVLSQVKSTRQKQQSRRTLLDLTPLDCQPTPTPQYKPHVRAARKGDVVSICPDESTQTKWKNSTGVWYAYVQEVRILKSGKQNLDLLWLYAPTDTTLGHGYYPFGNELFMSDNCSCGKEAVDANVVQSIVPVKWFVTNPEEHQNSFFVRQKFRTEERLGAYDFVRLEHSDFRCGCLKETEIEMDRVRQDYQVGDTVLVYRSIAQGEILEPAIIRHFSSETITLQHFSRCRRDLGFKLAPHNQLALADDMSNVGADYIIRHCKVASFTSPDQVKAPYDRHGAGDLWFVVSDLMPSWNIDQNVVGDDCKPQGMGIFCGAGSLDRGLEDGGGVSFKWGVDMAQHALHTYRANAEKPEEIKLFLGSVDDYLARAIQGSKDSRIANIGDVDVLAAGSPCPGFSILQPDRNSDSSLRNCSLVASVCSYVDFYQPTYLFLENVVNMAKTPGDAKHLNPFSQVLCCLVSMGYQVQQQLMDPAHLGSCQSRARIFIIATAPCHKPPNPPPQTHHCNALESSRAMGRASNGLPFGSRKHFVCPFVSLTAKEAFGDLPDISDSHTQTCIEAPDHRTCRHEHASTRALIQMIPIWPYGQNFMRAVAGGNMSQAQIAKYCWQNKNRASKISRSWSRIKPNGLVGCLTTVIKPHDAFGAATLHYDQPRTMSVMEARRVQGIPDDEIVVGIATQQWKQIGNGVDRKVSFAMGLVLADAYRRTTASKTKSRDTMAEMSREDMMFMPGKEAEISGEDMIVMPGKEAGDMSNGVMWKDGREYIVID